ncbi:DHS-like NAD/FAD-binding domain-containing protein [Neurospora hispaniola]|uniref:DHS-like NAD/FAD-binding domain-containing protein n=1 Tax=Neurospora hispaniola TaxID=588809 RepID=A0AAJ0MSX8_9PEZI|nr:DHS-like NAD/FAD-binding domain-containing protein [Neurospora hispaniola]
MSTLATTAAGTLRMRIPYRELPPPTTIIPATATTLPGAVAALKSFLTTPPPSGLPNRTVILTGAGLSVASGLADYRGVNGTYRVNKDYKPIFHHEFLASHETRQRYWARSYIGWRGLGRAGPNPGHYAIRDLGNLLTERYSGDRNNKSITGVITQNVDSFHKMSHPDIQTVELHGTLASVVCTSCRNQFPRDEYQTTLARLNPIWADFLREALASGALETEDIEERNKKGIKMNPDGDVDLAEAPYTTFRYPACPSCLKEPPRLADGTKTWVEIDKDGAWIPSSTAGVLKPAVIMFGESISAEVKGEAEKAIDNAGRMLILGTSLATYSAWRLAQRAKLRGMPIAIVSIGGVRREEMFFEDLDPKMAGPHGVRVEMATEQLLPALVEELKTSFSGSPVPNTFSTSTSSPFCILSTTSRKVLILTSAWREKAA